MRDDLEFSLHIVSREHISDASTAAFGKCYRFLIELFRASKKGARRGGDSRL